MEKSDINGVWRDGKYLIARHMAARFPKRCVVCGGEENCRAISCTVRKRPGVLPLLFWWYGVFTPSVSIRPYVCAKHRRPEVRRRWAGRLIVFSAIMLVAIGFGNAASNDAWFDDKTGVTLGLVGTVLLWFWVYYRIYRMRLIYAEHFHKRDAWIAGIHESVLSSIPHLSE